MKCCILLAVVVLVVVTQGADHPECGEPGCAGAGSDSKLWCENKCTSCDGHPHCNQHMDRCECHGHATKSNCKYDPGERQSQCPCPVMKPRSRNLSVLDATNKCQFDPQE